MCDFMNAKGDILAAYAAYSKDEAIRLQSSSGAIFTLLAEAVIAQKGVIYGVSMTEDCKRAEFIRVTDKEMLCRLRGSKYLQAKVGNTYRQVKRELKNGMPILFSGTGCQINGLKTFLGKEYENLVCVDVICHGVPSPALWKKYMEEKNSEKLVNVNFRCKDDSWNDYGMKKINEHGREVFISKDKDPYMQMFLRDYCLRPSCYECVAKNAKSSDITIGDFWGINSVAPEMNDGNGTSLVFIRTVKGIAAFEEIIDNVEKKAVSYADSVKDNLAEYKSVHRPAQRNTFFEDMRMLSFLELEQKYIKSIPVPFKRRFKKAIKYVIKKIFFRKLIL